MTIRVLHVAHWPNSGITDVIRTIAHTNAPLTHNFLHGVVLLEHSNNFEHYFNNFSYRWQLNYSTRKVEALRSFRDIVNTFKPHIVHSHSLTPALYASLSFSGPKIFHLHNEYPYLHVLRPKYIIKRVCIKLISALTSTEFVSVSSKATSDLSTMGITQVRTIPNGLPDIPNSKLKASSDNGVVRLVSACRLSGQKNLIVAVAAVANLVREGHNICYTIYGDGPERVPLERFIQQEGMSQHIVLAGHTEDPSLAICEGDGYLSTSHFEGFGLSILLAMRCALPVISTRTGELARNLRDGIDFFPILDSDVDSVIHALDRFLKTPSAERRAIGSNGRAIFKNLYTVDRFIDNIEKVYEELYTK